MDVFIVKAPDWRGVFGEYFASVEDAHAFIKTQEDMPGLPGQYVNRLRPHVPTPLPAEPREGSHHCITAAGNHYDVEVVRETGAFASVRIVKRYQPHGNPVGVTIGVSKGDVMAFGRCPSH